MRTRRCFRGERIPVRSVRISHVGGRYRSSAGMAHELQVRSWFYHDNNEPEDLRSMQPAQLSAKEVLAMFRRRKKYLVLPALLVTTLCVLGAFILPRKYESSTTIMVQRDEVLNPLMNFTMAVSTASEDRLRTFNEIVYSKATIQVLIDSLNLGGSIHSEFDRQELIKTIRKNIQTERPGPTTFRIAYLDVDPVRARQAVQLMASHFIQTVLRVENQRNELAVEFYEAKLEELKQKFETIEGQMVAELRSDISEMPTEGRTISGRIDETDSQIGVIDERIKNYQRAMTPLQSATDQVGSDAGKEALFELVRLDIPYAGDMRTLVQKYDELTRRYTYRYPEVQKIQKQITDLLAIMRSSIDDEIAKLRKNRWDIESHRTQLIDELKKTSVNQQVDKEKQSNVDIYRGLYEDMKIKLEQARTTRDLGRRGSEQFIIIDPAIVPTEPSKPNRLLISAGGAALGLFLGILIVMTTEILDSRIRVARDLSVYRKRIIAYIPEGRIQ